MTLTYTTVDRVHNMVPGIGSMSTLTSAQTVELLEYAEAEVNARIAKSYAIPVAGTVPMLQSLATDLGVYEILAKRVFTSERLKDSVWPDRFKEAQDVLDSIGAGDISLVDDSGTLIAASISGSILKTTTDGYTPTFTDGIDFKDMRHDPDKVDAQMDERDIALVRRIT